MQAAHPTTSIPEPVRDASSSASSRTSADVLLRVSDLRVTLPVRGRDVDIIRGVSFQLGRGEILGLAGESGSGKSVTALALLQLLPVGAKVEGRIVFDGTDLLSLSGEALRRFRGREARIVFQDPWSSLNPMLTIGRQLRSSLTAQHEVTRAEADRRALEVLERVGIPEAKRRLKQYPHELSGGMLQRVMIAYAIIAEPKLIICDEPTTALDVTTEAQILDLLTDLNRELGTSLVLTSHDLGVLSDTCDQLMVMYAGRLVEQGDVGDVLGDPAHPYTQALVAAMPSHAPAPWVPLQSVPGQPPAPGTAISGCAFAPRCPVAHERCWTASPPLDGVPGNGRRRSACWLHREPQEATS